MFGLFLLLVIKTFVISLPLSVVWLAFRRLMLSKSANAWLYAATGIFALLTTIGLAPWALGAGAPHPVFLVFAAMVPAVWYSVALLCNSTRSVGYDSELERTLHRLWSMSRPARQEPPLVLHGPQWPDAPQPVFRHTPVPKRDTDTERRPTRIARATGATRSLIQIARTMRGNASSDPRRVKLLPPPSRAEMKDMPFLKATNSA